MSDGGAEECKSHLAHLSPGHLGYRWSRWGLCNSGQDCPGATRGHPESQGRQSLTGPPQRGCGPVLSTEDSTDHWRCWLLKVRWGTGFDQECSEKSTYSGGRREQKVRHLSPDLCSAGERGDINEESKFSAPFVLRSVHGKRSMQTLNETRLCSHSSSSASWIHMSKMCLPH